MPHSTSRSQLIIQRDHRMVITPGKGREALVDVVRWCAQLRQIVAESYVYELSPLAIWGAASRGVDAVRMLDAIEERASSTPPKSFRVEIIELFNRYGALRLESAEGVTILIERSPGIVHRPGLDLVACANGWVVPAGQEGRIALACARAGWPVIDERAPASSSRVTVELASNQVSLRPYQHDALDALERAGSGVVLLPCGAGKTIIGIAAIATTARRTLILAPSREVGAQWRDNLVDLTTLSARDIALNEPPATSQPVAIATYQAATIGSLAGSLVSQQWGFVIYDEVHALPADVFRLAAELPASRRLGLTATLVREDGREREVFALVGPPIYEAAWRELERQGWIAPVACHEVRFPAGENARETVRRRIAVVERLLHAHRHEFSLVIGTKLADLRATAGALELPLITGSTPHHAREGFYAQFRAGELRALAMSKVGGFGVDLPNASVLIQMSGNYGSRQEEAQRLGRILRPADGKQATFYTVVAHGSREEEYARRRQRYLVDHGYQYTIIDAADLPRVPRSLPVEGQTAPGHPTTHYRRTTAHDDDE